MSKHNKQTERKRKRAEQKKARKKIKMRQNGGKSTYALKKKYCDTNGVHAINVPEPKPWKS